MFTKKEKTELEKEIDQIIIGMRDLPVDSKEYELRLAKLERLQKIQSAQNEQKDTISRDTLAGIAANLLGIGLICNFERLHVITSKALGFVSKLRIK